MRSVGRMPLTELVFADVHEFLSAEEPGVGAPLHVRLLLPGLGGRPEGLEGRVVYELSLLHNLGGGGWRRVV